MPKVQDIGPIYRGEDVLCQFTLTPTTDITGWTITLRIKLNLMTSEVLVTQTASITNAAGGVFTVALSASTTASLGAMPYQYDVWRTDSGSAASLSIGTLIVRPSVRIP